MHKNIARLMLGVALCLPLAACEDAKMKQENDQLKAHVAELAKDNGDLGNRVDALTQENAALTKENEQLKAKLPKKKSSKAKRKHHSHPTS